MENTIIQCFNRDPSSIGTLLRAFASRNSKFKGKDAVPLVRTERNRILISGEHAEDFNRICGLASTSDLNILYPFTIVYPYIMRVLCRSEMPFSLFRVLNTVNSITMFRPLRIGDTVDILCYNSDLRVTARGIETDIFSQISSQGAKVWENVATYLLRGRFKEAGDESSSQSLEAIPDAPIVAQWFFPARDRFRFARISGDTNGIHYWKKYARMLGFERDFAQPIRVAARCAAQLALEASPGAAKMTFLLKGPVYYERHLTLRGTGLDMGHRFDLYCEGNDRPCISGKLQCHEVSHACQGASVVQ
jgi:hypothetical protein